MNGVFLQDRSCRGDTPRRHRRVSRRGLSSPTGRLSPVDCRKAPIGDENRDGKEEHRIGAVVVSSCHGARHAGGGIVTMQSTSGFNLEAFRV